MTHLTSLYLNDNNLSRLPPDISKLTNLTHLDLSSNKLRSLPAELGDLIRLRELLLNNNYLRVLPYELGKLFKLQHLGTFAFEFLFPNLTIIELVQSDDSFINFSARLLLVTGLKGNPLSQEILVIYNEPNGTMKLLSYLNDNLAGKQFSVFHLIFSVIASQLFVKTIQFFLISVRFRLVVFNLSGYLLTFAFLSVFCRTLLTKSTLLNMFCKFPFIWQKNDWIFSRRVIRHLFSYFT